MWGHLAADASLKQWPERNHVTITNNCVRLTQQVPAYSTTVASPDYRCVSLAPQMCGGVTGVVLMAVTGCEALTYAARLQLG